MDLRNVRPLFPILQERTYLFSGGHAPASTPARLALQKLTDHWTNDMADLYGHLYDDHTRVRELFAGLIGAHVDEVAITDSTGAGSNYATGMIDIPKSGNVVFDEWSYPSSIFPWMLPGRDHIERRFVKARNGVIDYNDLSKAIDNRTIAVSISHVTQGEGFRHDLAQVSSLAHARGAVLVVDAAQSAGAMRIDVRKDGIDFLSTGACKWLLGATGVAFFYAARRHMGHIPPHAGAPSSASDPMNAEREFFVPKAGAERFNIGIPNLLGLAATRPGLEILVAVGIDKIESHVLDITGYCIAGLKERGFDTLTPSDPKKRGGVVAAVTDHGPQIEQFMRDRKIDIFGGHTYNRSLRIDPHLFNNRQDIDKLLSALDEWTRRQ